jgi:outer membrane protein assembly factor BamA
MLGQEIPGPRKQLEPSSSTQHDIDVPVEGSEEERAEAEQAKAKEEALKSLIVHGHYTFLPVPAFHYSKNESYWAGASMPILQSNEKDELQNIYAPFVMYNRYVQETVGINYYGYPSDTAQYSVTADYSAKIQRDVDLTYKNVGVAGGRYILAGRMNWFRNPFRRLFGIGNQTVESDETTYTSREFLIDLTAGIHLNEDIALMWTEHFHEVTIGDGVVESLPQALTTFPQLPGMNGAQILGHKLTVRYDTRDKQLLTTRGSYVNISTELNQNLRHPQPSTWIRTTIDARHFIPHYIPYYNDQLTFVARFLADTVSRHNIPFYERPQLGGETTLRGFGQNRFIDDMALLINVEERIPVGEQKVLDYLLHLEVSPFLDVGRVMSGFSTRDLKDLQVNPGVGLRILARPNIVTRVDIAYGRDGANFFVGLDYPF